MKIYSVQPWIWIWGPSLRKSEAKGRICALLSVPHGWAAQCAGFCRSHCLQSCAVIGTQSWLTEPVLSSSPPGLSREVWKGAAWLEESSPLMFLSAVIKLKAVFLWGLHEQLTKGQWIWALYEVFGENVPAQWTGLELKVKEHNTELCWDVQVWIRIPKTHLPL